MLRFFARLALIVIGCAALTGPCLAHAALVGSEPTEGSVVAASPVTFRLSFNEPVTPLVLKLFYPDGRSVAPRGSAQNNDLVVELPAAADQGTYALSWRVASADGHPIGGTSLFSVGHASQRSAAAAPVPATAIPIWLARIGVYLGWIGGIGGAFFLTVIAGRHPPQADRMVVALLGLGAIATAVSLGLQGLDELGGNLADLGSTAVWSAGLQSRYGKTLGLGSVALLLAAAALRCRGCGVSMAAATASLLMVAFAMTLSGHAGTAAPIWAARPALALHTAAATLWGGSLLPLLILVAMRHECAAPAALRLSAALLPTIAALLLSGAMLAVLQGVTVTGLLETGYGRLLTCKLILVLVMLALGALNRYVLVPRVAAGEFAHRRHLRRVLALDVCLLLAVLGVVAGWRFTPPPRSVATTEAALRQRQMLHIQTDQGVAMIELGHRGGLDISLSGADGRPMAPREVRVSLANPAAGIEPLQRQPTRVTDGRWRVDGLALPTGGCWTLRLSILVGDFQSLSFEGTLTVP